jgi:LysM repeat protein
MRKIFLGLLFVLGVSITTFAQGFKEHTVTIGETLSTIVEKYQVSPYELFQLNPDAEDGLEVGEVLVLLKNSQYPFDATLIGLMKYRVKKKETLYGIAQAHGVTEANIKKYNTSLYANQISKGDKIKIPVFNKSLATQVVTTTPKDVVEVVTTKVVTETVNHEVLPKEGKYGISKKYGITILELEAQNPEIVEGLKIGQVLTITKKTIIETVVDDVNTVEDKFEFYIVKPKEGFYSLTKKLGVSKDSLKVLNPSLVDGLKIGMILKYPRKKLVKAEVASFKLLDSISNYEPQHITLMLPLMLDKIVENDSVSTLKKVVMLDGNTNASLDFYSGALMAIDSMKNVGISTKLRVFDTQYNSRNKKANSQRISELLAMNYQENEVVIGPLVASNVSLAANGLAEKNIPVLAPFPLKIIPLSNNIYQTNASIDFQRDEMIRFIESYSVGKPMIIITDKKMSIVGKELQLKFPLAKVITPREGNLLIPKDFNGLLSESVENIIIVEAIEVGLLSTVTTILDTKLKKHKISLFTTSSVNTFRTIENRYKAKLNLHFPSIRKEIAFEKEDGFLKKYKSEYGKLPSKYALRGYDLTMDVLLRQAVSSTFENATETIGETSYLENKFNYYKADNGGYTNNAMYILHYTPELKIEEASLVAKIKEVE